MKAVSSVFVFMILLLIGCSGAGSKPFRFTGSEVRLEYRPGKGKPAVVYLAGSFNNWVIFDPDFRMQWDSIKKIYFIRISLKPGKYYYKFIVDGEWVVDPRAAQVVADKLGGGMGVFIVGE